MLEDLLENEGEKYKNLKAPDNMEELLIDSLDRITDRKNRWAGYKVASFILIGLLFIGFNSNTIAKLMLDEEVNDYEYYRDISSSNLRRMLKNGMAQDINKEHTFSNGTSVKIEGILFDSLGANLLFTVGQDDWSNIDVSILDDQGRRINDYGLAGRNDGDTGHLLYNISTNKRIEGDYLTIHIREYELYEEMEFKVKIDNNKRLKKEKPKIIRIDKKIRINGYKYKFNEMKVSPVRIIIDGDNESIIELALRKLFNKRRFTPHLDLDLLINGELVESSASSYTTSLRGSYFDYRFDDFPLEEIEELELILRDFHDNGLKGEPVKRIKVR